MLALEEITLTLGDSRLFGGISALINPGERIGLVGPNGAGKSTLLRIITGQIEPDGGRVKLSKKATVGYLPQDGVEPDPGLTVKQEVETAFDELKDLERKTREEHNKLGELDSGTREYEQTMERIGRMQDRLQHSGAYELESDIEKVLMGLGFSESDMSRRTDEFSGGWLMRIALAKLLLQQPTYLLLDEPTNHLDIESLQWIKQFLMNYEGAVIVVSHDRAFLDELTGRTLALDNGELYDYAGNYSFYETKHEEHLEHLRQAKKNQEQKIKQIQEFIDRFRYKASKAKQVQSRIKQLEKMDRIEVDDHEEEITFEFPPPERSGAIVMRLNNITKSYDDIRVFEDLNYTVERSDKIAVVGPNGAGKSTLIRIMAGIEPFGGGEREPGHNVTTAYFAQHQADELDTSKNAFEIMREAAPKAKETRLRTILGCFLFQGDDVFKQVSVLSGGEKSRLALARMLLIPANFLIFDEPTNHLDMDSKKILQQALQQYEGTVMIVSHDQSFLDPIVDKVLEVQPDETRTFHGNISYYLDKKAEERAHELNLDTPSGQNPDTNSNASSGLSKKEERRLRAQRRQEVARRTKPLNKEINALESEIAKMEDRKEEIETLMSDQEFYDDGERVEDVSAEYDTLKNDLEQAYRRWEELAARVEAIEQQVKERL